MKRIEAKTKEICETNQVIHHSKIKAEFGLKDLKDKLERYNRRKEDKIMNWKVSQGRWEK